MCVGHKQHTQKVDTDNIRINNPTTQYHFDGCDLSVSHCVQPINIKVVCDVLRRENMVLSVGFEFDRRVCCEPPADSGSSTPTDPEK